MLKTKFTQPESFTEVLAFMDRRAMVKIAHNTTLERESDCVVLRYHDNPIIVYYPEFVSLSSCGWRTTTTKRRLNQFTRVRVYQKEFVWYAEDHEFEDGSEFDY